MYVRWYIYNNHPVNTKLLAWKSVKEVSALERCPDVNMCVSFGAPIDRTGTTDRPTDRGELYTTTPVSLLPEGCGYTLSCFSPPSLHHSSIFLFLFITYISLQRVSLYICSNLFWPLPTPLSLHFQSPSSINGVGLAFG